jgi:signal peptidase I
MDQEILKSETNKKGGTRWAKQPWAGVLLSFILLGLGQIYAGRKKRGIGVIFIYILFTGIVVGVVCHPTVRVTWDFTITCGIVLLGFALWVMIDAYLCARSYNQIHTEAVKAGSLRRIGFLLGIILLWLIMFIPMANPYYWIIWPFKQYRVSTSHMPTGSMAGILIGNHFRLVCPSCGYEYNFGFNPILYGYKDGETPDKPLSVKPEQGKRFFPGSACPNCLNPFPADPPQRVVSGDYVLVNKRAYRDQGPERWELAVFTGVPNRSCQYLKRVIGRPGEKVEIIDGDVYINDQIQRKPPDVQRAMWVSLFDSDNMPKNDMAETPKNRFSADPFGLNDGHNSDAWQFDREKHQWRFAGGQEQTLTFDPERLKFLLGGFNAYNGLSTDRRYQVSDLRLEFQILPGGNDGGVIMTLGKYGRNYQGIIDFDGRCAIRDTFHDRILAEKPMPALAVNKPTEVAFENVDHQLTLFVAGEAAVSYEGGNLAEEWGYTPNEPQVSGVQIGDRGCAFTIDHIRLSRDIHYTNHPYGSAQVGRGTEGQAMTLDEDEYFVLGDNSSHSFDGRFWDEPAPSYGKRYRAGIVPRELLDGRAYKICWPPERSGPVR